MQILMWPFNVQPNPSDQPAVQTHLHAFVAKNSKWVNGFVCFPGLLVLMDVSAPFSSWFLPGHSVCRCLCLLTCWFVPTACFLWKCLHLIRCQRSLVISKVPRIILTEPSASGEDSSLVLQGPWLEHRRRSQCRWCPPGFMDCLNPFFSSPALLPS